VLGLAKELFRAQPEAYLLGIRGYHFDDFGEEVSDAARANLDGAVTYLERAIREGHFQEVRRDQADAVAPDPQ
jgi:hypothetical protein